MRPECWTLYTKLIITVYQTQAQAQANTVGTGFISSGGTINIQGDLNIHGPGGGPGGSSPTHTTDVDASISPKGSCTDSPGFLRIILPNSNQCFMLDTTYDSSRTWSDAKKRCNERGMILPRPEDPIVSVLAQFLKKKRDGRSVWLGAFGTNTGFVWDNEEHTSLSRDNKWWGADGQPGSNVGEEYCLKMVLRSSGRPYYPEKCTTHHLTLCEVIG